MSTRTKKKPTTARLRKELWKVFTLYIKMRDNWTCFTCGRKATGQGMGGGHYKPKGACSAEYYYSEINVNAQCTDCNLVLCGNQVEYRRRLVLKYGEEKVNDIDMNFRKPVKYYPYESKIEEYKEKNKRLAAEGKGNPILS
jgi:hypothetical protein